MKDEQRPVIIKKIRKVIHGGHHGGAWKVAYADFVTAMMAFFLLMWLLNAASEEQKRGLSLYFGPVGDTIGAGGSGGVMGGLSIKQKGNYEDTTTASPINTNDIRNESSSSPFDTAPNEGIKEGKDKESRKFDREAARKDLASAEEEMFRSAEKLLKEAISSNPELKKLADNLLIENTPEGLRIQIIDRDPVSMFPNGSAEMYPHTRALLAEVSSVIIKLPNAISITGHTDSKPYSKVSAYTNWELSSDRANATRRAFLDFKYPEERIRYIVGKADREPLIPQNPQADQNRRISITLLRNYPLQETSIKIKKP